MKLRISGLTTTKKTIFILIGIVIGGCTDKDKLIKERLIDLTDNYFNSTNKRPDIDSLKSRKISEEVFCTLSKRNSNSKILKTLNFKDKEDSIKIYNYIYDFSFPIAYDSRHTIINDSTQFFSSDSIKEFYTPSNQNYRDAEKFLIAEIKREKYQEDCTFLDTINIRNYYRQYSFYKQIDNDSMIYINALCRILEAPVDSCGTYVWKPMDWKNKIIYVNDGGDCYWQILINLTKKRVEYLMINGVA